MKKVLFFMLLFLSGVAVSVKSQVTIGKEKPAEKFSALEIVSNGENGLRLPRMTTAERDKLALSGKTLAEGLVIFNTETKCMDFWNGTKWTSMCTDVSGRYILGGKTCFDVSQTEGTTANGCKPLSSRLDDFVTPNKSFIYTFYTPTGSAYSELSFSVVKGDSLLANTSVTGNTFTITFKNDIVSRATGKDKTQALELTITAQYKDNNNADKQVSLIVSIQDCSCGCSVRSTLPAGWLTFMCFNLGADKTKSIDEQMAYTSKSIPTAAGSTDATVYGDLYQWGRKTDGHEKRNSSTQVGPVSSAVANKFITNVFTPNDWCSADPPNEKLWSYNNDIKSPYDPCPAGWRVPTKDEWNSITKAISGTLTSSWQSAGTSGNLVRWHSTATGTEGLEISPDEGATTALFLPAAGGRNYTDGVLGASNVSAAYWSNTAYNRGAYQMSSAKSSVSTTSLTGRASGHSVRCVAE